MELKIYKGFPIDFLKKLDINDALIPGDLSGKLNVLSFDMKLKKKLDASLTLLDENDSKWVTYEEYTLIRDRVSLSVVDYGLKATVIVNNLTADVFLFHLSLMKKCLMKLNKLKTAKKKKVYQMMQKKYLMFTALYFWWTTLIMALFIILSMTNLTKRVL